MIRRVSKTQKILGLIGSVVDDANPFVSYAELRRRLHGSWEGRLGETISNLKRCGYLEVVEDKNAKVLRVTTKGKLKALLSPRLPDATAEWDGRWRLVAFDIEEERKKTRGVFREVLRSLGFQPLQKSLWIVPYDVSEELEKTIDLLRIVPNVDYFIADAITNEEGIKRRFDLA